MPQLSFDVEAAKEQLTQLFRDRISAQGSLYGVMNVDIEDVDFNDIPDPIPQQDTLVAALKADLATAQGHALAWFETVQPSLTTAPQASINFAALWNQTIPLVLKELGKSDPDRALLASLFSGLKQGNDDQVAALDPVLVALQAVHASFVADAANFSASHAAFKALEALEADTMAAARTQLAKAQAVIASLNQEIDVDLIKADEDLAIASNAMKYGGKLGDEGKALGLVIGLVFIVSAAFAIDDLIAAVDQRLAAAQQSGEIQLELTLLSAQLLALENASTALAGAVTELDDMITSLTATIKGWTDDGVVLGEIATALTGTTAINDIVNLFDLGRTQAEWDDVSSFGTKWQTMEVSPRAANDVVLNPPADD